MTLESGKNFILYKTTPEILHVSCTPSSQTQPCSFEIKGHLHKLKQGTMTVTVYYSTLTQLWQQINLYEVHVWSYIEDAQYHQVLVETK